MTWKAISSGIKLTTDFTEKAGVRLKNMPDRKDKMEENELKNEQQPMECQTEERRTGGDRRGNFVERRSSIDRRSGLDRRIGLDRRRGPGRRRSDDRRSAEEGQMSDEQFEFLMAINEYKKANARPFPTWTEVLEIIKALGYRKVAEPGALAESEKNAGEKTED